MKTITKLFEIITKFHDRFSAFYDKSAWILVIIASSILGVGNFSMLMNFIQWCAFAVLVAAMVIFISRIFFPTIDFSAHIKKIEAYESSVGSAILVASVVIFCAVAFFSILFWAK